jgi:hypothetical protein
MKFLALTLPLFLGFSSFVQADDDVRSITLKNLDGEDVAPLKCAVDAKEKAAVVIFITTDCPIANSYAPEINRLHLAYSSRNVRFTLVHVDTELTDEKASKHATDYELKPAVVIDRKHQLVQATKAKVTPEAFVYDVDGKLRYRGRINNLYADLGQRRSQVTVHELRDALEAVINDREVATKETEALGCFIEEK